MIGTSTFSIFFLLWFCGIPWGGETKWILLLYAACLKNLVVSVIQVIEISKMNVLKYLLCTVILKDRLHTLLVKISHIFCYNSVVFTIVILPKCKELYVIHHLLKIHYFSSYENIKNYIRILYSSWSLSFLQCGSFHNQLPL